MPSCAMAETTQIFRASQTVMCSGQKVTGILHKRTYTQE